MSDKFQNKDEEQRLPDFDKAETDLLRAALKLTYKQRFEAMMNLIKMSRLLQTAKITHPPGKSK